MARQYYTASDAAHRLGISLDTLRRWDRSGRIKTTRDSGNRRLVAAKEIERLRGKQGGKDERHPADDGDRPGAFRRVGHRRQHVTGKNSSRAGFVIPGTSPDPRPRAGRALHRRSSP